jgi:hypothetical protein
LAGVPAATIVPHKHGWAVEVADRYIHTFVDIGIVYTVNQLLGGLAGAAYNYFNLEIPTQQ